jgi:hypothetical protein
MFVYQVWIDKEKCKKWTGSAKKVFAIAKKFDDAIATVISKGLAVAKDGDNKPIAECAQPLNVRAQDTVFVSDNCKEETVMYKDLAIASGLKFQLK